MIHMLLPFLSHLISSLSYPSILCFSPLCLSQNSWSDCLMDYQDMVWTTKATVVQWFPTLYINHQCLSSLKQKIPEITTPGNNLVQLLDPLGSSRKKLHPKTLAGNHCGRMVPVHRDLHLTCNDGSFGATGDINVRILPKLAPSSSTLTSSYLIPVAKQILPPCASKKTTACFNPNSSDDAVDRYRLPAHFPALISQGPILTFDTAQEYVIRLTLAPEFFISNREPYKQRICLHHPT